MLLCQEKVKEVSLVFFQNHSQSCPIASTWCQGKKLLLVLIMLRWGFFFFCPFLFNQSTCYSQFSFYQVLQKTEIWVPGSGRNPDTYILKDQVLLIVSQSSFPFHSLHLQFIYFRSISFLISFSPFHDFAFRKHDIDNVIWTWCWIWRFEKFLRHELRLYLMSGVFLTILISWR